MRVEREIGGVLYVCDKLPAEAGLALFTRVSSTLASAEGLFATLALGGDTPALIRAYFTFARTADQAEVNALVIDLANVCRRAEDGGKPEPGDLRELLELAFFTLGVTFGDFFPVLPEELFPPGEDVEEAA